MEAARLLFLEKKKKKKKISLQETRAHFVKLRQKSHYLFCLSLSVEFWYFSECVCYAEHNSFKCRVFICTKAFVPTSSRPNTSPFPCEDIGQQWLHAWKESCHTWVCQTGQNSNHEGWRISSVKASFAPITWAQIDFLCTNDHVSSRFVAINSGSNGFTSALIHPDISDKPLTASLSFFKEQFVFLFFLRHFCWDVIYSVLFPVDLT